MASKKSAASKAKKTAAKKAPAKKAPATSAKTAKAAKAAKPAKKAAAKTPAAKKTSTAKKATTPKTSTQKKLKETVSSKPTAKQPAKSKFDKKFIDEMEKQLHEERAKYVHSAEVLKAEADSLMEDREPGDVQFDEESGEGDTLAVERERDLALSAQARHSVDQIDQALERIKDGTYGVCNQSGLPIPKERLRAIPWALERVEYKAMGLGRR